MVDYKELGGFPLEDKKNSYSARDSMRQLEKASRRSRRRRKRTHRFERLAANGQRVGEAGDQVASFGKSLFWFGVTLIVVACFSIPVLIALFHSL